ncbi:hypothetical protein CONLIGDRAFT_699027 [Coniochaeta ligniaria NRRL 30616]|uniref:Uncharacterized protein n=1 Tax=Coniochaeta ligniaria NRRL 30616 TaxID=1408157 RepID=A0A1J7JSL6_9PEZI|nr:hypothetical protein CONLIGDRAFT_699027 [Coniochaeta ligniaria NRRL 30616]
MNTSPSDSNGVHLGLWTNWSRGPIFGATLTLTQSNANLLIAFVSFFVTYVGTRFWRIACLVLHFIYSSRAPRDGLYHQRQAILRNASSAEDGLYTVLCLGRVWRKIARHTWYRIVPLVVFAAMCVAGWTLAAGFSSKISTAVGNEVLLIGANCGALDSDLDNETSDNELFYNPYTARQLQSAGTYAQQCYSQDMGDSQYCTTYVQRSLNSTVITNASCPFDKTICQSDDANIIVDTGYLDSHAHFGLNAPEHERFQYRRVLHCAPLTTVNYTTQRNVSSDRSSTRYMYGPGLIGNWTYEYTNDSMFEFAVINGSGPIFDYQLGMKDAYPANGSFYAGSFVPVQELQRADADVNLIFISANKLAYTAPINDSWFKATTPFPKTVSRPGTRSGKIKVYGQDQPASPMGCATQEQLCLRLPEGRRCTPLSGVVDSLAATTELFASHSEDMLRRYKWAFSAGFKWNPSVGSVVNGLGAGALMAKLLLTAGSAGQVPDNQWQIEVKHWHDISMTSLQAAFVDTAKGPTDQAILPWVQRPNNTVETLMCNSQKINSTQFASFSVFGLLLTYVLGGLIMLTSYTLEPLIACISGRGNAKHYSQMEWCVNETLQLQRLAHEMRGRGTWARATEFIPFTKPREELAPLDLSDPGHPVLLEEKHMVQSRTLDSEWSSSPPSSVDHADKEKV